MPAGASEVSIATRNSSGFSMTIVSPAGSPVAGSSNLTVTMITGCPGDNRRLRAIDGDRTQKEKTEAGFRHQLVLLVRVDQSAFLKLELAADAGGQQVLKTIEQAHC